MKLLHVAAVGLVFAALTLLPSAAAAPAGGTIVVVATGSVDALAGPAQWALGVKIQDDSAAKAMRTSAATMARVRSVLVRAGVPARELAVSTQLLTAEDEGEDPEHGAFVVEQTVSVTAASTVRAASLVERARAVGGNYFFGPDLTDARNDQLQRRALAAAVDAARLKGQALAAKAGTTLGPELDMETGFGYDGFDPTEGKIYATVAVEFAIY